VSRERELERQLVTLATLEQAVGALRTLSARHFRAARAPLASARAYRDEIEGMLGALGPLGESGGTPAPTGIVLVTADLGLVGDYTSRLVSEARALRAERGPGPLLCIGRRALPLLAKARIEPTLTHPAPTSVAGLSGLLIELVDDVLRLRRKGELAGLWLVAARFQGAGQFEPVRVPVLPIARPAGTAPLALSPYCDATHLRAVIVREYLYAVLYETLLESLASEHGKRLVVAESARGWISERRTKTRLLLASLRRESSTQEVLELVAGARATRRPGSAP